MKSDTDRYLTLLERRLATLRLLATDLNESKSAYVTLDLRSMHQHTLHQENLCTEIRTLDAELKDLRQKLAGLSDGRQASGMVIGLEAEFDPNSARQLQLLLGGLKAIQTDVRRLSRVHSELLRRSRRSVNVLLNFLAHYSGTYPDSICRTKEIPYVPVGK